MLFSTNLLCKKNVLTHVVEHGFPPGHKHNSWNGLCSWGSHDKEYSEYINHSYKSPKWCEVLCNVALCMQSLLNSVLGIVRGWKHYKDSAKITPWMKHYKKNPRSSTQKNYSCMAIYLPSHKPSHKKWARHSKHYWRSKDKLISNILTSIPTHG